MEIIAITVSAATLVLVVILLLRGRAAGTAGAVDETVQKAVAAMRAESREAGNEAQRRFEEQLDRSSRALNESVAQSRTEMNERLDGFSASMAQSAAQSRTEAADGRRLLEESLDKRLQRVEESLKELRDANDRKLREINERVETELTKMREANEVKLEKMRETVDEKLHGTLEKRLGESFAQVSEKLEAVQRGLGEMQSLASGVGDLKRVLTNVKNRGGWGEVQLGRQLEDMLTPEQYQANVRVNPDSLDVVEFAITLPGRSEGEVVYLPIDAKFPQEGYERLLLAQESGAAEEADAASKALERALRAQAKTISEKYIAPPHTTDFAIMYLPTEGLYAEAIRRPGLCYELQHTNRVLVTGPTTLMAILNSLQMGFRTLAIEKSTSEVWRVLAAAKAEFEKYAVVLDKVDKQLGTVQNTVQLAGRRTRAINRTLRNVESATAASSMPHVEELLMLDDDGFDDAGPDGDSPGVATDEE